MRGDAATPGQFRRSQNWIGPPGCTLANATYVPPPAEELMGCLGPWESFLHNEALPPLVQAALAHSQFEAIHPFLDGNGRVGRLLTTLLFIEKGVLPAPLLYLSAFFEATREEYYARLLAVTEKGEWEEWLAYFLAGVAQQAEDALGRIERIDRLLQHWRERLARAPSRLPERVIELLAENPFWSVGRNRHPGDSGATQPCLLRASDPRGPGRGAPRGSLSTRTAALKRRGGCTRHSLASIPLHV